MRTIVTIPMDRPGAKRATCGHALSQAHHPEVILQRRDLLSRDDRTDIAVGTHEHPIAGLQRVGVTEMTVFVDDIAACTKGMDVQVCSWRYAIAFDIVAEQRPVRAREQLEETR